MSKYFLILLLIIGILVGVNLVLNPTSFFSKASPELIPREVKISNLSDNSFTVSWITSEKAVTGIVYYGQNTSLGQVAQDDRDEGVGNRARFTHHITIKKLDPNTTYYFKIGSGDKIFDDKGNLYTQATAAVVETTPPLPQSVFGKVTTVSGEGVGEAIIYITPKDGSLISSYTRDAGRYLLTLNNSRTKDLKNYLTITEDTAIDIFVQGGKWGVANSKAEYSQKEKFNLIIR